MRSLRLWFVVAALAMLVTAAMAAASHKPTRSHTDAVAASFNVTQTAMREHLCTGADGEYRQFSAVYRGTSTGDPRLMGNIVIRSHGLINQTTGVGSSRGTVLVRSEGRSIAAGRYFAVNTNLGILHGFIVGWVRDRTSGGVEEQDGSGTLMANFKATFNANGTVLTGQIGGTNVDIRTPAVIERGGCGLPIKHKRSR